MTGRYRTVLVTGVAGFIGSNLAARLLECGYRVIGIDNLSAGTLANVPPGVEFHKRDIRYPRTMDPLFEGVDAVFHLAAKNCLVDCLENPEETVEVNIQGTVNLLETCRKHKVRKLVYSGSSAEYEGMDVFPSRTDRVCPVGPYAASKHAAWLFCESYRRLHGQVVTTLRYFNVYGPAQDYRRVIPPVTTAFIMKMLAGSRPTIYGSGEKRRDFIYVDDVNRFHVLCLENADTDNRVFNLGSGVNYSVREIFDALEAELKSGLEPRYAPDLPGEAEITLADIREAEALGWLPEVDLREGLRRTIEYVRSAVMGER